MKTYSIDVETEKNEYISSAEEPTTELGMILQIWQDLTAMESNMQGRELLQEDRVVKNILEKILVTEFGKKELISLPEYYKKYIKDSLTLE